MKARSFLLLSAGLTGLGLLVFLLWPSPHATVPPNTTESTQPALTSGQSPKKTVLRSGDPRGLFDWIRGQLRNQTGPRGARANEALLTFKDAEAYRRFLSAAEASGLTLLGRIDGLNSVRVGAGSPELLARGLADHLDGLLELGPNPYVFTPQPPTAEERASQRHLPFGDTMLSFLGITTDHRLWGRGVTIAVLDSGIAPDATFGSGRVRHLDVGWGTTAIEGHGTAVASLAAGAGNDALGVAPSASLLSIRVTDAEGVSDTFTLAQGIIAATDSGAQIINISLGAYQNHPTLSRALDYAFERGAVVVASAGNDQAGTLTWPAADPRVISVGAVDALEQQVTFSNSGPTLSVTAPGYSVNTAWTDNQRVAFSGTSASAPIVAGAIASVMSQNPGTDAKEAWAILSTFVSEAGAAGSDPNYGQGILNVGWAMARSDPTRVDAAVASHYFNEATGKMEIMVQNRSAQGVAGLELSVESTVGVITQTLPWLKSGATTTVTLPVSERTLQSGQPVIFRSRLVTPSGTVDAVPANNRKTSSIQSPGL